MRWVSLKYIRPGCVLAQRVFDERGRTLLAKGVELSESLIKRLNRVGVRAVCIQDRVTEDIKVREFVDEQTKLHLMNITYDTLGVLASNGFSGKLKPTFLRSQFTPVLEDVIHQLQEANGAAEQLGSVYATDGELFHHSVNVTFYALTLGLYHGLSKADLLELGMGTLLHDVGKLKVPQRVLNKPGRLTESEFKAIQQHTSFGYDILKRLPDMSSKAVLISLQHHERMDGSGYPNQLVGDDIHLFSRLTAVVDVYEALTANRIYRSAFLPHEALDVILQDSGTKLADEAVSAFVDTISIYPLGMTLRLSNGDCAVVTKASAKNDQKPVIRVIEDATGHAIEPYELDMAVERDIQIVSCES